MLTPTSPRSVRLRSLHRMCRSMSSGPGLGLATNSTRHLVAARSFETEVGVSIYPPGNDHISLSKTLLMMIFPWWDMLVPWSVNRKTAVGLVVHPRLEVNGVLLGSLKQGFHCPGMASTS